MSEFLSKIKKQSGVIVFREIRPEYAVPVGVWQVREGIRQAMKSKPSYVETIEKAIELATKSMSISKNEWLNHGTMLKMIKQKSISDFF